MTAVQLNARVAPARLEMQHEAQPRIGIVGVSKVYPSTRGSVEALRDINLAIGDNEFVSVLGPSGCGKSTLLRCIAGLTPLSTGEIRLRGRRVDGPVHDVGVVFQRDLLLDWRTVLDNVLFSVEFRGGRSRDHRDRALQLLSTVGLSDFANRYPWELSGGMRQRVAICRALLPNPPILLMDEPFGALDAMTRDTLGLELQRICAEHPKTVLLITHSIDEAVFLSDRVVVMSHKPGRVLDVATVGQPRPRRLSYRESREFAETTGRLRRFFIDSAST